MILDRIVEQKKKDIKQERREESLAELKNLAAKIEERRSLRAALKDDGVGLIAEVKKASPSKGLIREDFKPVEIAKEYEKAGASAISVLTDYHFFKGNLDYLKKIKKEVKLPLLRKDFIIEPYQIYQAKVYGADAILLIAAILEQQELEEYYSLAQDLGLDVLLEVHNRKELEMAIKVDADIIGINNRDLKIFEVDLATTLGLSHLIPQDKIIVSESGIKTRSDIELLAKHGIRGVLVGEALMRSDDISMKVRELIGE